MPKVNTTTLIEAEIKKNESDFAKSSKSSWYTGVYNKDKDRLDAELADELREPSYVEYKASGNKIKVHYVREGRGVDLNITIDLKYYVDTYDSFYALDMEQFTCYILSVIQSDTECLSDYWGKDHPNNREDFNREDRHKWNIVEYATKRIKKLLA